jgi:hypothetical protein
VSAQHRRSRTLAAAHTGAGDSAPAARALPPGSGFSCFVGLQDGFREHLLLRLDSLSEEMCVATLQLFDTIISQFHQALAPCKRRTVLQHVC